MCKPSEPIADRREKVMGFWRLHRDCRGQLLVLAVPSVHTASRLQLRHQTTSFRNRSCLSDKAEHNLTDGLIFQNQLDPRPRYDDQPMTTASD